MDNTQRLQHWELLRHQLGNLPAMATETLRITARTFDEADALLTAIADSAPRQGWLTYQSASLAFTDGQWRRDETECGLPLRGEWTGEGGSYQLAPAESGWCLTTMRTGEGDEYLCDDIALLATRPALGHIRYRRLWRDDAAGVPRPWSVRFVGFSQEEPQG